MQVYAFSEVTGCSSYVGLLPNDYLFTLYFHEINSQCLLFSKENFIYLKYALKLLYTTLPLQGKFSNNRMLLIIVAS